MLKKAGTVALTGTLVLVFVPIGASIGCACGAAVSTVPVAVDAVRVMVGAMRLLVNATNLVVAAGAGAVDGALFSFLSFRFSLFVFLSSICSIIKK